MQPLDPEAAFREALLDLAEESTLVNVRRYLAASSLLASAKGGAPRASARPRPRRAEKQLTR
jgi:hypothetical protein